MPDRTERLRICLAASAGGHLIQLLRLKDCWTGHDTFYVTTTDVIKKNLQQHGKVYVVGECNRQHHWRVLKVLLHCIKIVLWEKPNVVISTGAAIGCIMCFFGKLTGAKVIWIDSITNVEWISLSGRMVRHIADLFLVQWPNLAEQHKNVEYVGAVT